MKLIGIAGKARSGKGTVAGFIAQQIDGEVYHLATPLKEGAARLFGLPLHTFSGDNPDRENINPFWGISPREMLQKLGTECMRHVFRQDFWLMRAEKYFQEVAESQDYCGVFIVSDVRFENEADWVRDKGGVIIHMERELPELVRQHSSEAGIVHKPADYCIDNTDITLETLEEAVETLLLQVM